MASSDLKLLGSWSSPFSLRVIFALNIKSVPYHFQQENVLISKSDLLLQSNPVHKKIPVLIHENRPICESLAIVEYIDEAWASGHAILPSDPFDRAVARFWAAYIDNTVSPLPYYIHRSKSGHVINLLSYAKCKLSSLPPEINIKRFY